MVVPDLENRTVETMKAEHWVLKDNGRFFIGWHVTNQETARALVRGGRYVPPERIGSVSLLVTNEGLHSNSKISACEI